jgi:hypothetical protein
MMAGINQSLLEQIAESATSLAIVAKSAIASTGQPSQQAVLADLYQQSIALSILLGNITTSNESIQVGNIQDSSGIAIGAGAQSSVQTVNTDGGDYVEGNLDKRQGVFVSGGQVNGPVVGINSGTIETP